MAGFASRPRGLALGGEATQAACSDRQRLIRTPLAVLALASPVGLSFFYLLIAFFKNIKTLF